MAIGSVFSRAAFVVAAAGLLALAQLSGAHATGPANDDLADALVISEPLPFSTSQSTLGATTRFAEPAPCGGIGSTVWFSFTPSTDTTIIADTSGSSFDTALAVYTANGTNVACNDDWTGFQSRVIFEASAGVEYVFQVGGFMGQAGDLVFNVLDAASLGAISGRVTDAGTGAPVAGICVEAYVSKESPILVGTGESGADGAYRIVGLKPGEYFVLFRNCQYPGDYIAEWYDDSGDFFFAETVTIAGGSEVTGIDAALELGGSISGTVTAEDTGAPLEGICVDAIGLDVHTGGYASTGPDGSYTIPGLETGAYVVSFWPCGPGSAVYAPEWYDDAMNFETANPVAVTQGTESAGIDAQLAVGGSISGTVTSAVSGGPLAGICVDAWSETGTSGGWATTDSTGSYTVGGLSAGDYVVSFSDCNYPPAYASEFYPDSPAFDGHQAVPVTLGEKAGGIDAALPPASAPGDVDCDGDADTADALSVMRYVAGIGPSSTCINSGDVNCDSALNAVDALDVLRHAGGLPSNAPEWCPAIGGGNGGPFPTPSPDPVPAAAPAQLPPAPAAAGKP